ncbi:hypothetical protein Acy02nite_54890 [Actinoplanes cyaneus]|uniref:Uncharacterized protein n=1 Tax=Actinoplanes cyaneus TaxID=52696 RepID=A0A919ILI6_9ACTN|nr:hypothetical protein [Actinoplanes cyaneus]MCW2140433.1 hypothetical protein [Actinoplanes cyaneus]GID67608.1 hypothetical protein Acy02nite_54890 [Actinoplanes cyaneus]
MSKIALLAGSCLIALGATACSSSGTTAAPATSPAPGSAPVSTSAPVESGGTPSAPAGFAPVGPGASIQGGRQFTFGTVQSGGQQLLTVGSGGIVTLTDHLEDPALFVTTPVKPGGDKYLIQTAKLIEGGEPWCLSVHSPGGSAQLQLKTVACDAGKQDQVFTFPKAEDGKGVLIEVGGLFVLATSDGKVIAQESGEGDGLTAFTVRDQGKSTIPHLGD